MSYVTTITGSLLQNRSHEDSTVTLERWIDYLYQLHIHVIWHRFPSPCWALTPAASREVHVSWEAYWNSCYIICDPRKDYPTVDVHVDHWEDRWWTCLCYLTFEARGANHPLQLSFKSRLLCSRNSKSMVSCWGVRLANWCPLVST